MASESIDFIPLELPNETSDQAQKPAEEKNLNVGDSSEVILEKSDDDPYAYLDRPGFSAEKFKIEIKNLPKIYGINEFRKLINNKLKLGSSKVKVPKRNCSYAFVCFRDEEGREKAIQTISNYKWKGNFLTAVKAKPSPDPLVKKRKENAQDADESHKKIKLDNRTQEEKLKDTTIPLWNIPYEKQKKSKHEEAFNILKRLGNELKRQCPELREWLTKQQEIYSGLPCEFLGLRHAEQNDKYRNKCSFTVGIDETTKLPTVGFRIGSYNEGHTGVGRIEALTHIPDSMKLAVKLFEDYVRKSELEIFNFELHTGHFRQLMIRVTSSNQIMLVVGIHPQNLTIEKLENFKKNLIEYFTAGPGKEAGVTSLYYQAIVKKNPGEASKSAEHLWGDTHICETLLDLKFKISPEAFFQTNTNAAEIMYSSIIELADLPEDKSATVLDVCCGTGTIGLCFAKKCNKILGVEIIPEAIEDAKANALLNDIQNSEFFVGKAEETLGHICYRSNDDIIAIVDPPRAGLQQKGVQQLRRVPKIKNVVFAACNPAAALKNFIDLGRPVSKTLHNEPFVPIKAVAIDMFPHTKHYELLISFKRFKG